MITESEKKFMEYWEANREKQKKIKIQWMIGLPTGLLFGLPILLNLFSGWDQRIPLITSGQLNVLIIAVLLIISFISIFTIQHKWDLREQHYKELLQKIKKENSN
jgi:integral membrane sensor domain MASE1